MKKIEVKGIIQKGCEDIFGVGADELEMGKTLFDNGMGQPEQLILMLKLEADLNVEADDTFFNQKDEPDNPQLFGNRPVKELVDYMYELVKNK